MSALLVLLLQATGHAAVAPPLPYYARHVMCWCEKCDGVDEGGRRWTAARDLVAYGKQGVPSSKLFTVSRDEEIRVLDGVVIVDRADRVRVLQPMTLLDVPGTLKPGDVFWRVQIWGEGGRTVWHNGRLFETSMMNFEDCEERGPYCSGVIEEKGIRQWWVKVRNARGQIGWVRADWNFIDDSCGVRHER